MKASKMTHAWHHGEMMVTLAYVIDAIDGSQALKFGENQS